MAAGAGRSKKLQLYASLGLEGKTHFHLKVDKCPILKTARDWRDDHDGKEIKGQPRILLQQRAVDKVTWLPLFFLEKRAKRLSSAFFLPASPGNP